MGRRVTAPAVPPLVSIVLCTYNRADLLPRAIDSVQRQTYEHWQLVIVDDGSTDGTARIVDRFMTKEPRIVAVRQQNRGLALARNVGIAVAEGDFVAFLDSDDELKPDHLAVRVKYMRAHPKVDMVYGGVIAVGPKDRLYVPDLERPGRTIHVNRCYVGGTFFARKRLLNSLGGFRRIAYGEDLDLMHRAMRRATVHKVTHRSYIYHCEAPDRLSDHASQRTGTMP